MTASTALAKVAGPMPQGFIEFIRRESAKSSDSADLEPPNKRQRLSSDLSEGQHRSEDDFVTAIKFDVELEFSDKETSGLPPEWRGCHRFSVTLDSIHTLWPDKFRRLRLSDTRGNRIIDSNLTSPTIEGTYLQQLQWSINVQKENRRSTKRSTSQIAKDMVKAEWFLIVSRNEDSDKYTLQTTIKWRTQSHFSNESIQAGQKWENLLSVAFPQGVANRTVSWSPQDFYRSVHVPDKDAHVPSQIQSDQLDCQLYDFQKRAVQWMLRREGFNMNNDGSLSIYHATPDVASPSLFYRGSDAEGRRCLVSHLFGIVCPDTTEVRSLGDQVRGGILAEEMGLGKTVELISLICLNKRKLLTRNPAYDEYTDKFVIPSSATLIITPPSIIQQWQNELTTHAPALKVLRYEGLRIDSDKFDNDALVENLLQQDVVLTTYNVLSSEIHYAGPPPDRSLRHAKKYAPRRSPLTQISWWRVCLDEAQMVESGVSNAATVARLIPRCNAWAVSGTPVRKNVKDLLGLLIFLRYEPFCGNSSLWSRLVTSFKDTFRPIFKQIALRHTKEEVRDEIKLPPQKRVVITVPFTQIEEQHYSHLFQQMCADCGLDANGGPLADTWDPESPALVERMRNWLTRLRQTCLHPEIGIGNRRALGQGDGPLRTVSEVLEVMIDQNQVAIRTEHRSLLMSRIRRGQILENAGKSQEALELWLDALKEAEAIVEECRTQLAAEAERQNSASGGDGSNGKGKGKDTDIALEDDVDDPESDGNSNFKTQTDTQNRVGMFRQRLRAALEVQHMCIFFSANAYFQMKSNTEITAPDSEEYKRLEDLETAGYERAKEIRKEMLLEVHGKVETLMHRVGRKAKSQSFVEVPELISSLQRGGIESQALLDGYNALAGALNEQANMLDDWREKMIQLLIRPLVDEDDGIDLRGDEYETSTKEQDTLYVYMEALRAVVADRNDALTGQTNFLIQEEMKNLARKARNGDGPLPELLLNLLSARSLVKPPENLRSLRGIIAELRSASNLLRGLDQDGSVRARMERTLIEGHLTKLQASLKEQTKVTAGLDQEIELFRGTMNARLEYYRQLQQVSDAVAPVEEQEPQSDPKDIQKMLKNEEKLAAKLSSLKAKARYLLYLREESSDQGSTRTCVICQGGFEVGALTVCGHQYCKECMGLWWAEHKSCPVCKKHLNRNDLHQITYKPRELVVEMEYDVAKHGEASTKSAMTSIYSGISNSTLNEIKNIDLDGSFGSKIDTIIRHLLWIRENDPSAKSVLFSQYREFLKVLGRALTHAKIGFTGLDQKGGVDKFKNSPAVDCFLLDLKTNSSGLNLVNATHVFLCEPLINTALELQAIARVHRIGQHHATTVWMYLVDGTVEQSIYEISVSRRMSHLDNRLLKGSEISLDALERNFDAANSSEMEQSALADLLAKGQSGGEMVQKDDLWNCLFQSSRKRKVGISEHLDREVGRHLRAEAAEERREHPENQVT